MRIITGKYKGKHFEVPRSFKARPTTDFAKENLFNVLRASVDFEATPISTAKRRSTSLPARAVSRSSC